MDEQRHWSAEKLMQLAGSCWHAFTLQAAVMLDVFTAIGDGAQEPHQLADTIQADRRALTILLDALAAMGLLVKADSRYRNSEVAMRHLIKGTDQYVGHMIAHFHRTAMSWVRLADCIRAGGPASGGSGITALQRENFLMGMHALASQIAEEVSRTIDLAGRQRLLDLGGGPGTHAIQFCHANPGLKAVIYDRPETEPWARKLIDRDGLSDRIVFAGGNYLEDDIPGRYDAVWLSQILHAEGPEDCVRLIRKAAGALLPGGMIYVHDFILDDSGDRPLFPAIFSLNMLVNTPHGQAYTESAIRAMLTEAGVKNIERLLFSGTNESAILCGSVSRT